MSASISTQLYTTGFVTSKDGTTVGYRQMGQGDGVVLVHGGMQASQSFMNLAAALSDEFTVYILDRRGRGLSGGYGSSYSIQRDVEDMDALLNKMGARYAFGLSSGAIILLRSALVLSNLDKLALYEPALSIHHSNFPAWLPRFDREVAEGNITAAMVTVMKGTGDTSIFAKLPRFLMVPLLRLGNNAQNAEIKGDDVPLATLVQTMHYDAQIIIETEDTVDTFRDVTADVLLLGGSKSAAFLKRTLDCLSSVLPHVQRIEFPGFDHLAAANDGHPEWVAQELRRFFHQTQNTTKAS